MGTRSLLAVLLRHDLNAKTLKQFMEQFKLWQYNQYDGYPAGLGADVFNFLKSLSDQNKWDEFVARVSSNLVQDWDNLVSDAARFQKFKIMRSVLEQSRFRRTLQHEELQPSVENIERVFEQVTTSLDEFNTYAGPLQFGTQVFETTGEAVRSVWGGDQAAFVRDCVDCLTLSHDSGILTLKCLMAFDFPIATSFASPTWVCDDMFCEYAYIIDIERKEVQFLSKVNEDCLKAFQYHAGWTKQSAIDRLRIPPEFRNAKKTGGGPDILDAEMAAEGRPFLDPLPVIAVFKIDALPNTEEEFVRNLKMRIEELVPPPADSSAAED